MRTRLRLQLVRTAMDGAPGGHAVRRIGDESGDAASTGGGIAGCLGSSGAHPAVRAARLEPMAVLRHE